MQAARINQQPVSTDLALGRSGKVGLGFLLATALSSLALGPLADFSILGFGALVVWSVLKQP
jgi:hypothetical protein